MAYSGTTTFVATRDQICTRAYAKLGALDSSLGEVMPAQAITDFAFTLNIIVKETMANTDGVLAWDRSFNTLFLQQGQFQYSLGPSSTDKWTTAYVSTTTTANTPAASTSLTVSSITGFTNGMNIGIKLDSGVTYWTTINGAPAGTTITLTTGLPAGSNASSGAWIYAFTTVADRPQKVIAATRESTSDISTIMNEMSAQVYMQLPTKGVPTGQNVNLNQYNGTPLMWYFENDIPNATFTIWQPPTGTNGFDRLTLYVDTILQDFDNSTDNPWFPIEWTNYLIWQLAAEMADEFEIPEQKIVRLWNTAAVKLKYLKNYCSQLSKDPIQFGLSSQYTNQNR